MIGSWNRICAILLRQFYMVRRSPPRIIAMAFWPTMQMVIWGCLNVFLTHKVAVAGFTLSTFLGAALLLNFFERSNVQTMWGFLEDIWGRNIGNILITPISTRELLSGYILNGFMMMSIAIITACIFAFLLFDYSVFVIGLSIIPFIINLTIFGWCIGILLICLVLRYGASGEHFAWMMAFALIPLMAVYYPVSVLPDALQYVSWMLPPTYVFEALRETVAGQPFNKAYFLVGLGMNIFYLLLCGWIFHYQLEKARMRGGLLSMSSE